MKLRIGDTKELCIFPCDLVFNDVRACDLHKFILEYSSRRFALTADVRRAPFHLFAIMTNEIGRARVTQRTFALTHHCLSHGITVTMHTE